MLYSEPPEVALLPVPGLPAAPRAGAHRREDPVLQAEVGMEQFEYLLVLAGCLAITAPLEFFGARVYRRPVRLARAVLPVAPVFLVWDFQLSRVCSINTSGHKYGACFGCSTRADDRRPGVRGRRCVDGIAIASDRQGGS